MIELTFLKVLMLIKQVHQKSVIFAAIGICQIKGLTLSGLGYFKSPTAGGRSCYKLTRTVISQEIFGEVFLIFCRVIDQTINSIKYANMI